MNIKTQYLDKFDLVTPSSGLFLRYVKYLFDNVQEFPQNQKYLRTLQEKYQIMVEEISDFDYDEFQNEKELSEAILLGEVVPPKPEAPAQGKDHDTMWQAPEDKGMEMPDLFAEIERLN